MRPARSPTPGHAADIGPDQINGSKVADQGLSGVDILDSSVSSADLATNSVNSEEILDGAITHDEPSSCSPGQVTGLPSDARDHLVLTEASATTNPFLVMSPVYSVASGTAVIRACNLSDAVVPGGTHTLSLLVIDAD